MIHIKRESQQNSFEQFSKRQTDRHTNKQTDRELTNVIGVPLFHLIFLNIHCNETNDP